MATNPIGLSPLSTQLRARYGEGLQRIRGLHDAGGTGLEVVHDLTELVDGMIREAFDDAVAAHPDSRGGTLHLAVLALGGYGRRQLNPQSDVDLLGLLGRWAGDRERSVLKRMLHTLYDSSLRISHVCRTIHECGKIAATDLESLTSMLENRLVCGTDKTFEQFRRRFTRHWTSTHLRDFLGAKIRQRAERVRQWGETINVAEPNLKESPGGLRDYHFVLWLSRAFYGADTLTDLQEQGVIDTHRLQECVTALDLLLRMRSGLHFQTGRCTDELRYDLQEVVAKALGYVDAPRRLAEELMMRDYYSAASTIQDLSNSIALLTEATLNRGRYQEETRHALLNQGWSLHNGLLRYDNSPAALTRRPGDLMEVFWLLHKHQAQLSQSMRYTITQHLHLVADEVRADPLVAQRFRALMAVEGEVAMLLRAMRDTGFLGAYIPEWNRIHLLVRKDLYHRYSVDEHLILTVRMLERVGEISERFGPEWRDLWQGVARKDLLRLAALFHDIGKGGILDHSVVGARLTTDIMTRLGYPEEDVELVRFLVLQHLLLSHTAFHRDMQVPGTLEQFVEAVGDITRLDMLLLLTIADAAAVRPGQLTDWKAQLVMQVAQAARQRMTPSAPSLDRKQRLDRVVARLEKEFSREEIEAHLAQMAQQYILHTRTRQIARHLNLLRAYDGETPRIDLAPDADNTVTISICAPNHVGLFSRIAKAFLRENLSIRDARLQNRKDGIALDTIVAVKDIRDADFGEERQAMFARVLLDCIQDAEPVGMPHIRDFAIRRSAPTEGFRAGFQPKVSISNDVSPTHTVVQVSALDRMGVLYTISATFAHMGYDIHFARVNTEGARINDVFYITRADGDPLHDADERDRLAETLRNNLAL